MESTVTIDLRQVGRGLETPLRQIQATVELLDEGNTVPFITRYRKDQTGGLDEEQIREIQGRLAKLRLLAERKQTILRSIESQGKLTEKLTKQILGATTSKRLEDLYLPFKPKKQTLATLARSRGLEPLAREILEAAPTCLDLDVQGGRFHQHGSPRSHRRRRPAGRRAHPRRANQRAGRAARAAARGVAADRRTGEQPAAGRREAATSASPGPLPMRMPRRRRPRKRRRRSRNRRSRRPRRRRPPSRTSPRCQSWKRHWRSRRQRKHR